MSSKIPLPGRIENTLAALWRSVRYYGVGLYLELSTKHVFLWAQAIAFKVLVTVIPIVVLATGIIGRVLQRKDAFATVALFIRELLPPNKSQGLIDFMSQLQSASGTIVGIGGIGLFLSAMSLFITLRVAVSNAFEQDWHQERSLLRGYLFDARMVMQVGAFFILTVGVSAFLPSFINDVLIGRIQENEQWIRWLWNRTLWATGLLLPLLITTVMFFHLYYFVPKPHPRKRSALVGATIAAVLWEATKQAFTYYATYVGQFNRYNTETLGNTFGLVVAFVFWVYFSGIVLMIGAVLASLREHRHVTSGELPRPESSGSPSPADDDSDRAHGSPGPAQDQENSPEADSPNPSADGPVPSTPPSAPPRAES